MADQFKEYGAPRSRPAAEQAEKDCLGQSIAYFRKRKGLSRSKLAEKLDMTLGGVSAWEYGRTRPDLASLKRLCRILEVSSDELLGIASAKPEIAPEEADLLKTLRARPPRERAYISEIVHMMFKKCVHSNARAVSSSAGAVTKRKSQARVIRFPLNPLSMCAGQGIYLDDAVETETIELRDCELLAHCDEVVRVSGDSMEPLYSDGDLALVQHTQVLREGEIGVFVIDGEGMIKQYQTDGLHPLNPAYSVIRPEEYSEVRCFGRVLGKVEEHMLP